MQQLTSSTSLTLVEDFNLLVPLPMMVLMMVPVVVLMIAPAVTTLAVTASSIIAPQLVLLSLVVISSTLSLAVTPMLLKVNLILWMSASIIPLQHLNSITIIGLLVLSKTTDSGVILMHLNFAEMLMIAWTIQLRTKESKP